MKWIECEGLLFQSLISPLISTSLYFIVFGSAIGSRITEVDGIPYGSFHSSRDDYVNSVISSPLRMLHSEFSFQNLLELYTNY